MGTVPIGVMIRAHTVRDRLQWDQDLGDFFLWEHAVLLRRWACTAQGRLSSQPPLFRWTAHSDKLLSWANAGYCP